MDNIVLKIILLTFSIPLCLIASYVIYIRVPEDTQYIVFVISTCIIASCFAGLCYYMSRKRKEDKKRKLIATQEEINRTYGREILQEPKKGLQNGVQSNPRQVVVVEEYSSPLYQQPQETPPPYFSVYPKIDGSVN